MEGFFALSFGVDRVRVEFAVCGLFESEPSRDRLRTNRQYSSFSIALVTLDA